MLDGISPSAYDDGMATAREPHENDLLVGARIRMRRKSRGISQGALAESVGLTFQQIQKYERGSNRVSASKLIAIAKTLECSASELLGEAEGDRPSGPPADYSAFSQLAVPGAREILSAFIELSPKSRRAFLALAKAAAERD